MTNTDQLLHRTSSQIVLHCSMRPMTSPVRKTWIGERGGAGEERHDEGEDDRR